MTVQPKYHWQFKERDGTTTADSVNNVQARLSDARLSGHGRIGLAMHLLKKGLHVNLGKEVGQFGTGDFTVAFGMRNINTHKDGELDIIGNQSMKGHGNFFSLRLVHGQTIFFHVDENSKAKHYVRVRTDRLSMLPNKAWLHIAAVRAGRKIKIYIDGVLEAEAESKTGVANIKNNTDVRLGHYKRGTPTAQYEDLRVYNTALNATEIQALIPPANRPLQKGEIELVATDNTAVILNQDVADLSRLSNSFKKLRVGAGTGVTLYRQKDFAGTAQKCYADLPNMQLSKIESFPNAIRIWPTAGEPFTGKWIIKAPNGEFLSREKSVLSTAPRRSFQELFRFHFNLHHGQLQLLPGSPHEGAVLKISPAAATTPIFVEELENRTDEFFVTNQTKDRWLELGKNNTFNWTVQEENRALFTRVAKRAVDESQVGELAMGEVALYEHKAYHGQAWILSDSEKDQSGNYKRFGDFQDLNDQTSSIRLGPNTGVTLFKHFNNRTTEGKRETEIEDIVDNAPDMSAMQLGDESLSSIRIFRTISPEDVFTSFSTKLSQDYRLVDNKLQEFSSYRTILKFEPGAGEIEVSATDLTEIEVEGTTHEIDERRSVTLKPNELNSIMITSEADGLNTPGLKIRTSEMEANERVVIFPNEEAHQQVVALEDGALWNAKDAKGDLIVDRNAHSQEEVASVQNTIKRVMGTVSYAGDQTAQRTAPSNPSSNAPSTLQPVSVPRPVLRRGGSINVRAAVQGGVSQAVSADTNSRVQLSNRVVSGATIDKPWSLELKPTDNKNQLPTARAVSGDARQANSTATNIIQEVEISQDEFARLLSQAIPEETNAPQQPVNLPPGFSAIRIGNPFKRVGRAIKKATSVVIGVVKDVVNVVVKTAEGVFKFVVDTVEKVAEFVEAVVEKVVKSIKQFIEFLQFLFNWGDILKTQRYLVKSLNAGFSYTTQLTQAAKEPLSAFVDDLQGTVESGIDSLIESLGGSSEMQSDDSGLPEAAEWFFAKVLGGSKKGDAKTTPEAKASSDADSALSSSFSGIMDGFKDVITLFLRDFEGLAEALQMLVTNPLKPQLAMIVILETIKDVIIQALDLLENVAITFLDAVGGAIAQLQNLLNANINIPFITQLFKFIGAGKLTILNLTGLLLAIPVTIVYKIIFNERPFKDAAPLDFSDQSNLQFDLQSNLLLATGDDTPILKQSQSTPETSAARESSIRSWGVVSLIADLVNGLSTAILDAITTIRPPSDDPFSDVFDIELPWLELTTLVLDGFSWLASFPSSHDFPGGRPYHLLGHPIKRSQSEQLYRERVMWGWRTAVLGVDIVLTVHNPFSRMKREEINTNILFFVFSAIDLGLTSSYLASLPNKDGPGLEIANEVIGLMPSFFSPLLLMGEKGSLALALIDITAAVINTGLGSKLLADDLADV